MNMQGGGGFELWQFLDRQPCSNDSTRYGDLGIFAIIIKCPDVQAAYDYFSVGEHLIVSCMSNHETGPYFWLTDKYGQVFKLVQARDLFANNKRLCAGVCGAVIGVGNMDSSLHFYKELLGLHHEEYNLQQSNPGPQTFANEVFHTVLLQKKMSPAGPFSQLLGGIEIELVQAKHYDGQKIYADRYWGDIGFIHLCFDVLDMCSLKVKAQELNYPFTVDSKSGFSMEKAGGRFCYVEDPDGTMIELVETYNVPILKKFGWHLNLKNRKHNKPLPSWMIKTMGLNRLK